MGHYYYNVDYNFNEGRLAIGRFKKTKGEEKTPRPLSKGF